MSIFEYDKEKEEKKLRKAERECGREEGREEQAKITAFRMGKKGRSPEEIAELIDFDVETVKKWLQTTEE